ASAAREYVGCSPWTSIGRVMPAPNGRTTVAPDPVPAPSPRAEPAAPLPAPEAALALTLSSPDPVPSEDSRSSGSSGCVASRVGCIGLAVGSARATRGARTATGAGAARNGAPAGSAARAAESCDRGASNIVTCTRSIPPAPALGRSRENAPAASSSPCNSSAATPALVFREQAPAQRLDAFGSVLLKLLQTSTSCPKFVPGSPHPAALEGRVEPGPMGHSALGSSSTLGETRRGLRVSPTSDAMPIPSAGQA